MRLSSLALPWIAIFTRKCDCHAMVNSLAIARIAISIRNLRLSSLRLYDVTFSNSGKMWFFFFNDKTLFPTNEVCATHDWHDTTQSDTMGRACITSWYPNFHGNHFGLPPSEIHKMTGLPPKIVWTMTYSHRPHLIYSFLTNWRWRCTSKRREVHTNISTGHLL